jgi:hypothetical protein
VICTEVASSPMLRTVEFRHGLGCCMNRWKVGIVYNGSRRGIDTRRTLGLIICPNSRQSTTYCGGVDITPSIDRLTHVVHGLYWQLDSPVGQSRASLFLLSWTSDVGVSRPGLCRTSKHVRQKSSLLRACCCHSLPTNHPFTLQSGRQVWLSCRTIFPSI